MTDQTDDHLIADGVDEEPVEANRRMFEGTSLKLIATLAGLYAAFHMAALNGLSISEWTGVTIPFLPTFPMETWNFRIVHVAGALALGFLIYSARSFPGDGEAETTMLGRLSWALMVPAVMALVMALYFASQIAGGLMWNGIDETIKFNETWLFGAPLLDRQHLSVLYCRGSTNATAPASLSGLDITCSRFAASQLRPI